MRNLKKSLAEQHVMGYKLSFNNDELFSGIVTHLTPNIVAIQSVEDFELAGTVVVPIQRISEVRDNAHQRCIT